MASNFDISVRRSASEMTGGGDAEPSVMNVWLAASDERPGIVCPAALAGSQARLRVSTV